MKIGINFADRDFRNHMRASMRALHAMQFYCGGNILTKKNVMDFIRNILFSIEEINDFSNGSATQSKEYFSRIINEESIFFDEETRAFLISRDYDCNGSYFQIDLEGEPVIEDY